MTREELKAIGVADESIDGVMKLHGVAVTEAKNSVTASVTAAFNAEKESMQKELNRYQKGGDLFVDTKEFKRLQEFEQTTLNREITDKKTKGLKSLYTKANASESVAKLLIQSTDLNTIELDEKGKLVGLTTFRLKDSSNNVVYGISYSIPVSTILEYITNKILGGTNG